MGSLNPKPQTLRLRVCKVLFGHLGNVDLVLRVWDLSFGLLEAVRSSLNKKLYRNHFEKRPNRFRKHDFERRL